MYNPLKYKEYFFAAAVKKLCNMLKLLIKKRKIFLA